MLRAPRTWRHLVLITVHHSTVSGSLRIGTDPYLSVTSHAGSQCNTPHTLEMIMKTLLSALVALTVVAGIASAPASALDARKFFDQYDRTHGDN
jgi:hypothetical protein